jgi:hypothetical protein
MPWATLRSHQERGGRLAAPEQAVDLCNLAEGHRAIDAPVQLAGG